MPYPQLMWAEDNASRHVPVVSTGGESCHKRLALDRNPPFFDICTIPAMYRIFGIHITGHTVLPQSRLNFAFRIGLAKREAPSFHLLRLHVHIPLIGTLIPNTFVGSSQSRCWIVTDCCVSNSIKLSVTPASRFRNRQALPVTHS